MTLRPARFDDCAFVWDVNFAPDVRAVSGSSGAVTYASHATWFAQRLCQPCFWIVEDARGPAGTVRIDGGTISIALAAEARGRGLGREAIREACRQFAGRVIAKIRKDNRASRDAFEACGFVEATGAESAGSLVTYAWTPGDH